MNGNKSKIVIAGGSGFLGRALAGHFQKAGFEVAILTRSPGSDADGVRNIEWDARTLGPWAREIDGCHAIINLTGRSVNCRYGERNRKLILDSRVESTRVIGEAIARCSKPPVVWLNASTATIYRHTFGPAWDESGEIGAATEAKDEFSIHVAKAWERAFAEAQTPHTRKVAMRAAMVFGLADNSVFPVLRRLARLGLGGRMAGGRQFVSWIHEADFCRAVEWLIRHPEVSGPVNICSPNPVRNAEMMKLLGRVCGMPIGLPAAKWMLELGAFILRTETELTIKSRHVVPGRLLGLGFAFKYPQLRDAMEDLHVKMEAL